MSSDPVLRIKRIIENDHPGVFIVGRLSDDYSSSLVSHNLARRFGEYGIETRPCILQAADRSPIEAFSQVFGAARTELRQNCSRKIVVLSWCLEHLQHEDLVALMKWMNPRREYLYQGPEYKPPRVPVILLTSVSIYQQYITVHAGDLLSILSPIDMSSILVPR